MDSILVGNRHCVLALLLAGLLAGAPAARADDTLVSEGPDVVRPIMQGQFMPRGITFLNGDRDFPVVFIKKVGQGFPQFVLLVVDARNGKDTWSLREDPVVFYLLYSDTTNVRQVFLDEGFADQGQASGKFITGGPGEVENLVARLGNSYSRCRSLAAFRSI